MPAITLVSLLERNLVLETAVPHGDIRKTNVFTPIVCGKD
jgi:hypothetical protein